MFIHQSEIYLSLDYFNLCVLAGNIFEYTYRKKYLLILWFLFRGVYDMPEYDCDF